MRTAPQPGDSHLQLRDALGPLWHLAAEPVEPGRPAAPKSNTAEMSRPARRSDAASSRWGERQWYLSSVIVSRFASLLHTSPQLVRLPSSLPSVLTPPSPPQASAPATLPKLRTTPHHPLSRCLTCTVYLATKLKSSPANADSPSSLLSAAASPVPTPSRPRTSMRTTPPSQRASSSSSSSQSCRSSTSASSSSRASGGPAFVSWPHAFLLLPCPLTRILSGGARACR